MKLFQNGISNLVELFRNEKTRHIFFVKLINGFRKNIIKELINIYHKYNTRSGIELSALRKNDECYSYTKLYDYIHYNLLNRSVVRRRSYSTGKKFSMFNEDFFDYGAEIKNMCMIFHIITY